MNYTPSRSPTSERMNLEGDSFDPNYNVTLKVNNPNLETSFKNDLKIESRNKSGTENQVLSDLIYLRNLKKLIS